jgi:hypothetical protein
VNPHSSLTLSRADPFDAGISVVRMAGLSADPHDVCRPEVRPGLR